MFVNKRNIVQRAFKRGDIEQGVGIMATKSTKLGKAEDMTAGAGTGVGRLQKAGFKTKGYANGGIVSQPFGGGKSRGGGAAVRGTKFKGVY